MKRIKKYMRICLGTALISLTACQPDMDFERTPDLCG